MTDLSNLFANVLAFIEGNPESTEGEIIAFIKKDKFYLRQYIDADDICEICTFVCKKSSAIKWRQHDTNH